MITNNKNRENHWLYSDKEQDELIKCRLTVPGAENLFFIAILTIVRWISNVFH